MEEHCWGNRPHCTLTQRTWIWANSGRERRTEEPGELHSMGLRSQTRLNKYTSPCYTNMPSWCDFPDVSDVPGYNLPWERVQCSFIFVSSHSARAVSNSQCPGSKMNDAQLMREVLKEQLLGVSWTLDNGYNFSSLVISSLTTALCEMGGPFLHPPLCIFSHWALCSLVAFIASWQL